MVDIELDIQEEEDAMSDARPSSFDNEEIKKEEEPPEREEPRVTLTFID